MKRSEIFADGAPLEVDLGCGDGSFLLEMAQHYPDRRFLGVERLLGRVRKVCRRARQMELQNLKVLRLESLYTVEWLLPRNSISRIHLLFPDPWPKARHHKRRLFQEPFLRAIEAALIPGGEFNFKTDHAAYFEWAQEELAAYPPLNRIEPLPDTEFYPVTDFERQWTEQGRAVHALRALTAS